MQDKKALRALNSQTSKFGLKDIICRDTTMDIFKDLFSDNCDSLDKNNVTEWVQYKFLKYKLEKKLRKLRNMVKSKIVTGTKMIMT